MTYQPRDGISVRSLLEILRTAQDAPSGTTSHGTPLPSTDRSPAGQGQRRLSRTPSGSDKPVLGSPNSRRVGHHHAASGFQHVGASTTAAISHIPSRSQLDDLLRTINASSSANARPSSTFTNALFQTGQQLDPQNVNAEAGPSRSKANRTLIEPFGPITAQSRPSLHSHGGSGSKDKIGQVLERDGGSDVSRAADPRSSNGKAVSNEQGAAGGREKNDTGKGKGRNRDNDPDWDIMPFNKALSIISDLLEDPAFRSEVKKMKADQDALERRMWAKSEKVKADHARTVKAEEDIARLAKRPISPAKRAQFDTTLHLAYQDFYRQTFFPSVDSLSNRQRARLKEMGVPGLGREDDIAGQGRNGIEAEEEEEALEQMGRIRKIMDLIQAVVLEE